MSNGLPYLSLRCVLEYLDFNKRIHITARSPALRKFEDQIPLHIDHLTLKNNSIRINSVTHSIETMMFFFRNSKEDIYVNRLEVGTRKIWGPHVLPTNLQLKIKKLDTGVCSLRDAFLDIIHPSSFPLVELITGVRNEEDLNQNALKSAKKLVISSAISDDEDWFIPSFANLTNTSIIIEGMTLDGDGYIGVIQSYLSSPRSIGASLEIRSVSDDDFESLLNFLKDELNGVNVNIEKPIERLSHHTPCSIRINATSVALVYGIYYSVSGTLFDIKVEIIPFDAVTPVVSRQDI